jgi:hypothetical protein
MNAVPRERPEPVDRFAPGTGSGLSEILACVLPSVRAAAGDALRAVLLSGSHATGEAVWVTHAGRRVSLSDLDLYVVLRDAAAVPAARRAWRSPAPDVLLRAGLAAPAEAGFDTLEGLVHMPARPGTVELARAARVVEGEEAVLARLPRHAPAAISADERLRLLENRAFELLWARLVWTAGLEGMRARHAVLKCALDLAASRALAHGELPAGAAARVARAVELGEPTALPGWLAGAWAGLGPLWREAVAWREGAATECGREPFRRDWRAAARGWAAAWWAETRALTQADEPFPRALAAAARGSLARRWRHALRPLPCANAARALAQRLARVAAGHTAPEPERWVRWRRAAAGTPVLRLHGAAAVLVLAAAEAPGEPALPAGALHALRTLGFPRLAAYDDVARVALCAWGRPIAGDAESAEGA